MPQEISLKHVDLNLMPSGIGLILQGGIVLIQGEDEFQWIENWEDGCGIEIGSTSQAMLCAECFSHVKNRLGRRLRREVTAMWASVYPEIIGKQSFYTFRTKPAADFYGWIVPRAVLATLNYASLETMGNLPIGIYGKHISQYLAFSNYVKTVAVALRGCLESDMDALIY